MPNLFLIVGPNGSGKSTAAQQLLGSRGLFNNFLNADDMARALSANLPRPAMADINADLQAGRLLLKSARSLLQQACDFAIETTGASRLASLLNEARSSGYHIHVLYLWLETPELAIARVANRVMQGGHAIPESVIRRRYVLGMKNLVEYYLPFADSVAAYDNSDLEIQLIIMKETGTISVYNKVTWACIVRGATQ